MSSFHFERSSGYSPLNEVFGQRILAFDATPLIPPYYLSPRIVRKMNLRSRHSGSISPLAQPQPFSFRTHLVPERACSGRKRTRVPRHLKVWALEEQKAKGLTDQETADVLKRLLIEKKLLNNGRDISRTAVLAWRKKLKEVRQEEAGQSLSFRQPLYKELYEATKRLVCMQLKRWDIKLTHVTITQGQVGRLAEELLPVLTETLEKRIVEAVEKGDAKRADGLRPALCAYSRCLLSPNWAQRARKTILGECQISLSTESKGVRFSDLPPPRPAWLRSCVLHGLSFLDSVESVEDGSISLKGIRARVEVQLVRSRLRIERWEVSRLMGDGWLTDSVVHAYCKLIEKRNRERWARTRVPRLWVMDPILFCKILRDVRRIGLEKAMQEIRRRRRFSELLSGAAQAGMLTNGPSGLSFLPVHFG